MGDAFGYGQWLADRAECDKFLTATTCHLPGMTLRSCQATPCRITLSAVRRGVVSGHDPRCRNERAAPRNVALVSAHLPGVAEREDAAQALLLHGGADVPDGRADDGRRDVIERVLAPGGARPSRSRA